MSPEDRLDRYLRIVHRRPCVVDMERVKRRGLRVLGVPPNMYCARAWLSDALKCPELAALMLFGPQGIRSEISARSILDLFVALGWVTTRWRDEKVWANSIELSWRYSRGPDAALAQVWLGTPGDCLPSVEGL